MTQYKVTAPSGDYDGNVGKVGFTGGVAVIDEARNPAELAYCRGAGYLVEPADEDETSAEPPAFDPAEHDMPTVLAYLKDADAAEATRVLDAEDAGKDRRGITGQRDAILASKQKEGEDQ